MTKRFGLLAAFAIVAAAMAAPACSGSVEATGAGGHGGAGSSSSSTTATATTATTTTTTSSSGSGGAGGAGAAGGAGGVMCAPSSDTVLAVSKIYYGDTDFDDTPDAVNGWKQYGFNIDGLVSTPASVDLCQPVDNAPKQSVYPDGNNGIDNSFGKNVLPIFLGVAPTFSSQANAALANGDFTVMLDLQALVAGTDQSPVTTKIYLGAQLAGPPAFDGSDCWPVTPQSLTNAADIQSAKLVFPSSTLVANHWDSGVGGDLVLALNVAGLAAQLTIHQAHLAMDLDAGHENATTGLIGGVLDTEELVAAVNMLLGEFDAALCSGATVDSIDAQIRQASDILKDGTQDPAQTCNGISIGLGFKAARVGLGPVAPAAPMGPNPCGP